MDKHDEQNKNKKNSKNEEIQRERERERERERKSVCVCLHKLHVISANMTNLLPHRNRGLLSCKTMFR